MVNITTTDCSLTGVAWDIDETQNETLAFAGIDTWAIGTILGRKEVTVPTTMTADGGNTGDGTVTAVAAAAGDAVPLVGTYVLTCDFAVTNGGVFKLADPNGGVVASNLTLRVGAGLLTTFTVAGLTFTITDGATDFAAADFFTLAVAADNDLKPYVSSGVGGIQHPKFVMLTAVTSTGAEDINQDVLAKGKVDFNKLIIDADGNNSNVTDKVKDQLAAAGILVLATNELRIADNS